MLYPLAAADTSAGVGLPGKSTFGGATNPTEQPEAAAGPGAAGQYN